MATAMSLQTLCVSSRIKTIILNEIIRSFVQYAIQLRRAFSR
jgi:hypothetical protein